MAKEHFHFLGIGGHAMRGLALALREQGYTVTGTDPGAKPPGSTWLDEQGITWYDQSDPAHLHGVDTVIVSGHTPAEDPEVVAAKERGLAIKSFAQLVGELTRAARTIVVAGTHGKTTTTSLLAWIFEAAGKNPDYLVGIQPHNFASSVRLQGSDLAVIEGDEYRASQLEEKSKFDYYHPDALIVTSLEMDHPDFFSNLGEIEDRFQDLIEGLPAEGKVYYDPAYPSLQRMAAAREQAQPGTTQAYGDIAAEFTPEGLILTIDGASLQTPLYGRHNVKNAHAAYLAARDEGIEPGTIGKALSSFQGAARRFERVSAKEAAFTVLDDYAHHPTEVATTIEAARQHFSGQVIAVFQPHTYSRTKELLADYAAAFAAADAGFILPIEGAREGHLAATVSHQDVAQVAGDKVSAVGGYDELLTAVKDAANPGDTILCMTVGGSEIARRLAESLNQ